MLFSFSPSVREEEDKAAEEGAAEGDIVVGEAAIAAVYARCYETLPAGGVLLNGDFIKPDGTDWEYEPGRFEVARHLDYLRAAGFTAPRSIGAFEMNTDNPTAAQNYACLMAVR